MEDELRNTQLFRPAFDSKSLDAIEASTAISTETLRSIDDQIGLIVEMLDSRFREMKHTISDEKIRHLDLVYDYSNLVEEKTRDFVGREFIFAELETFLKTNDRGYFVVIGEPGIGKTSLAAYLIRKHDYIHHFIGAFSGMNRIEHFMQNICRQLIEK